MELTLKTEEPTGVKILTGFHQDWLKGEDDDGTTFQVTCGAGLGSPHIKIWVTLPDGTEVYDHADIRDMVTDWVNKIRDAHTTVSP